ncbi:MAG TPA: cobalamin-binding protein [Bacteroidota bacterium]|nr:cobalamin-binding protein [Bacteroidota bacterium]
MLPSATEIVYALGLEDRLVAVTHECDFPDAALRKPRVTRSRIHQGMPSKDIDLMVRRQLDDSGTLYELDVQTLDALSPDIILTQQLCTVCAVSYDNVFRAAQSIRSKPEAINLEPSSLEEIYGNILLVGDLAGVKERAEEFVAGLRRRVSEVERLAKNALRRNILCLEWVDPPFCAGHWTPELVELAGGYDSLGRKHQPSAQLSPERIVDYNPEILVIMCCGFTIDRALTEIPLLSKIGIESIDAIQHDQVYLVDGSAYFNRPGPRIIDSLEILASIFHPEIFGNRFGNSIVRRIHIQQLVELS